MVMVDPYRTPVRRTRIHLLRTSFYIGLSPFWIAHAACAASSLKSLGAFSGKYSSKGSAFLRRYNFGGRVTCEGNRFEPTSPRSGSASAVAASRRRPIPVSEEMGTSVFGFFDPLSIASDENFARYREGELKHGRVAMAASVGLIVPDFFKVRTQGLGLPNFLRLQNFQLKILDCIQFGGNLSWSAGITFSDVPAGIGAIWAVPLLGWAQILLFVGVLERFVFVQRGWGEMPGDYGTGYFGKIDKSANERQLLLELDCGRLAMIAVVGQVAGELMTGYTVIGQWREGLIFGDLLAAVEKSLRYLSLKLS
mmetsp:Transcript_30868/g.61119  ORF Transcript_30868/g.61119 Transcript_30868/m.61119 type:complete len:309 (+) Transcript_30868:110-1036(+)